MENEEKKERSFQLIDKHPFAGVSKMGWLYLLIVIDIMANIGGCIETNRLHDMIDFELSAIHQRIMNMQIKIVQPK